MTHTEEPLYGENPVEQEMIAEMEQGRTPAPVLERIERPDILTYTGHYFSFVDPENSDFTILDIAQGLSNLCRFGGHCKSFYSVAEHSVLVSHLVQPAHQMAGLLHDSAEGLGMVDVPRPLKQYMRRISGTPGPDPYKWIEERVERAIFARFGLEYPPDPVVQFADRIALYIEQAALMPPHDDKWTVLEGIGNGLNYRSYVNDLAISTLAPADARNAFLQRFYSLQQEDASHV